MTEWKDISTAPKDGRRILLSNGNIVASGYWPLGFFRRDPGFYFDGASLPSGASHWMPLPPPPAPKGEGS